jgi:hypothetical protein
MMRKQATVAGLLLCLGGGGLLRAQQGPGSPLPITHAKTLSGAVVTLPATDHTATLILAGFSKNSSAAVKAWWLAARGLCQAHPKVACYRAAVLQDAPGFVRGMIVSGMRKDMTPAEQEGFVTVFENEPAWKRSFRFGAEDDAYVALFDKDGKRLWQTSGDEKAANSTALEHAFDAIPK